MDFRAEAQARFDAASALLDEGDDKSVLYACLEARMSIEALSYDLLELYRSEVSYETMSAWQPGKLLEELRFIDPEADASRDVSMTIPETGETIGLGTEHRFSAGWAKKAHNALGSFLHQPTQRQTIDQASRQRHREKARRKVEEICVELKRVFASQIRNFRASRLVKMDCPCGFKIARDILYLDAGKPVIRCECGREWTYSIDRATNRVRFSPAGFSFRCPHCDAESETRSKHELKEGLIAQCRECGNQTRIMRKFTCEKVEANHLVSAQNGG